MKKLLNLFLLLLLPLFVLAANKVELNTASLSQLEELIGVGPITAQKIIDARPFASVDDLLKVKGIGEKTLQKIKDQGIAYVAGETQALSQENQTQNTQQNPILSTYSGGVIINEILPAPEGADDQNEYIEIYNSQNIQVDISGWKLQDTQGTQHAYVFPKDTNMPANGYLTLKRPQTNITLNNDADGVNLITPDGKVSNNVEYNNAPQNQSYNYTISGWKWSATLTPGFLNAVSLTNTASKKLPGGQKTDNTYLSAVSEAIDASENPLSEQVQSNPWFLFLGALGITILAGTTVLIIKFKIKKNKELI